MGLFHKIRYYYRKTESVDNEEKPVMDKRSWEEDEQMDVESKRARTELLNENTSGK